MDWRLLAKPLAVMLAVNVAVSIGVFMHKIPLPPYVPYIHLLVDYHFGFIKRALIGAIVSLFTAEGAGVAGVRARRRGVACHARAVRQTVPANLRLRRAHLPLFVFIAGSPFFLKNFMHTLGHFDIYGCLFAIVLLLVPARSIVFVLLAALFSIVLILIHHIHLLMYVPTIAVIVVRQALSGCRDRRARTSPSAWLAVLALGALFFAAQFWGTMPIPEADFVEYLKSRMADPSRTVC